MANDSRSPRHDQARHQGAADPSARGERTGWRRREFATALAAAPVLAAGAARAQGYPARPIRVIIPFPPGGIYFPLLKAVTDKVSADLKTPFVLEHRPGAGTTLGTTLLAQAAPDGYTLGMLGHVQVLNVEYFRVKAFDVQRDFVNIAALAEMPTVLVTHANAPFKTLNDMMKYSRSQPGRLNYGAAPSHPMDLLAVTGDFDFTNIPFKGQPGARGDLLAGSIDDSVGPVTNLQPLIAAGKVVPLAVLRERRTDLLPGVPAIAEFVPNYGESSVWVTLAAPKGIPEPILKQLRAAFAQAMTHRPVLQQLESQGFDTDFAGASEQAVAARIAGERARARSVLAKTGNYSN